MSNFVPSEQNRFMKLAGDRYHGENLYDFRFYELEIVDYDLPLAVFRWDGYSRNDNYHRHCDFYELVLVFQGSAQNDHGNGKIEQIGTGSVFVLPPGSIHRYLAIKELSHYNVLFRPELLGPLRFDLEQLPGYQLLFKSFGPPGDPANSSPVLYVPEEELAGIILLLEQSRQELSAKHPGYRAAAVAAFLSALTAIGRHVNAAPGRCGENAFRISRVVEMLSRRYAEGLSMESMAKFAGMSESNFRHQFSAVIGIAPGEYLTRLRLKMAAPLLTTPESITAIAYRVGFEDSNYFTRQFRKYAGVTPSRFRKQFAAGEVTLQALSAQLLRRN